MGGTACWPGSSNTKSSEPHGAHRSVFVDTVQSCAARRHPPSAFPYQLRLDAGLGLALVLRVSAEFFSLEGASVHHRRKGRAP
jgi:hypothetical protein